MSGPFPVASRKSLGIPAPRGLTRDPQRKTQVFFHYTVSKGRVKWLLTGIRSMVRTLWSWHVTGNKWADIGYPVGMFQPFWRRQPVIVLMRPLWAIPAAQGGHNSGTIPIVVFARDGERFLRRTEDAAVWFITKWLPAHGYRDVQEVGGHRDVTPTSCPGDAIYARVDDIARRAGKRRVK